MSLATPPLGGSLLVAAPTLGDANFDRTVVLVLDHDESGTLGVVINRPTPVPVDDVLPAWAPYVSGDRVLFAGGPVGTDSALALARLSAAAAADAARANEDGPLGFRAVGGGLGLVDLDVPPEAVVSDFGGLRVFAGYSGWGPGQLEAELEADAWFVVSAQDGDAFAPDAEGLWRAVLRRQRGELAWVSTAPEDPSMN